MSPSGWILLWRQLREHPFWRERRRFSKAEAWIDLLMDAAYEEHEVLRGNTVVPVKRGQALISQRAKAAQWGWHRETVGSYLRLLEKVGQASVHETGHGPNGGYTLLTITNYKKFQNLSAHAGSDESGHDSGRQSGHEPATTPAIRKKGKEERKNLPGSEPTWEKFNTQFSPEGQEVLRQTVVAVAGTRKTGQVAQSILDGLARDLSRYPGQVVLRACQTYLDRGCAGDGKDERYLLGIARGEFKRASQNGSGPDRGAPAKTPGQLLIEQAARATLEEPHR